MVITNPRNFNDGLSRDADDIESRAFAVFNECQRIKGGLNLVSTIDNGQ